MTHDSTALYNALESRDPRFDGLFFVGVTSTGIYCRPICTARTPRAAHCRFFTSAAAAEKASFRPCLRCRPELAPGSAPVDDAKRIAGRVAYHVWEGMLDEGAGVEDLAAQFELSSRQVRRIVKKELGVSPMELIQTRRLLLAKQLLTETTLQIIEVAYASGFSSLRRFNDAFRKRYGMAPTRLRNASGDASDPLESPETLTLQLDYRPPFDWPGLLSFLGKRAMQNVETTQDDAYFRTVALEDFSGWICVRHAPTKSALKIHVTHSLAPALPGVLRRIRQVFDLSARPDVIAGQLTRDELLADAVGSNPGLRVPGAFDGFELAVRAILGQQISVKAATTLAGRFAKAFGDPIDTPHATLSRISPTPQRVAAADVQEVAALGIVRTRAASIVHLAKEVASGRLSIEAGARPDSTIEQLVALPGIGPWTAHYIAMRALRWPDAFPSADIALRNRLGGVTAAQAETLSQAWRPWRSYATLHLWESAPQNVIA